MKRSMSLLNGVEYHTYLIISVCGITGSELMFPLGHGSRDLLNSETFFFQHPIRPFTLRAPLGPTIESEFGYSAEAISDPTCLELNSPGSVCIHESPGTSYATAAEHESDARSQFSSRSFNNRGYKPCQSLLLSPYSVKPSYCFILRPGLRAFL